MRYVLTVYNVMELSSSDVRDNGLSYVLRVAIIEAYLNKIVNNNYILALRAYEYDDPVFSPRYRTKFSVSFKAEFETEKFYPGRILTNCRIDSNSEKLIKATYLMQDGHELPIIVLPHPGLKASLDDFSTPLIITNVITRGISVTLRCVAEVFTPLVALDFINDFNYPHTLSHYNEFPDGVYNTAYIEKHEAPALSGGAKKKALLSEFYYKFETAKTRKIELYYHLMSRIIGSSVAVSPTADAKTFGAFLKRIKSPVTVKSDAPQKIIFTTVKKAINDVAGLSGIDIAVIDDTLDNVPDELTYLDIYKPICSPKYYVIVTTDGLLQSRDYCAELLDLDKQRRETIDNIFAGQALAKELVKSATAMYKKTFK